MGSSPTMCTGLSLAGYPGLVYHGASVRCLTQLVEYRVYTTEVESSILSAPKNAEIRAKAAGLGAPGRGS